MKFNAQINALFTVINNISDNKIINKALIEHQIKYIRIIKTH